MPIQTPNRPESRPRPYVIVLGNEKGGSGKSTAALHLTVALLRTGRRVGVIDLDARQATLSNAMGARAAFAERRGIALPQPRCIAVDRSTRDSRSEAEAEETERLDRALGVMARGCGVVVVDCPGADTFLSRQAHRFADTLLTPINDSFLDLSMLAGVDGDHRLGRPSVYSEAVWEARKARFRADGGRIDWLVMRNRLAAAESRNGRLMGESVARLSRRIGFRPVGGFGERTIFRELHPQGLTLLDLHDSGLETPGLGALAARAELRALLAAIRLPPLAAAPRLASAA